MEPRLILAVHVIVALGFLILGALRVTSGNVVGGVVNGIMSIAIVAVGVYIARRQ